MTYQTLEDAIGNTPLVKLQRIAKALSEPKGNVILGKLEGNNPAGSVKDRPALSMIKRAEERGEIKPGDTLIEATSGNTGIALAMAFECFMEASKAEFPGAQFRIGRALMRGHGVPKNKPAGVKWLLKAAKADHTDAMIALGATLMSGDGVEVNYRRGAEWFQKAADLGNAEAMYELATFHIEGDGVEEDPEKVKHWMFKAAALGQSDAIEWVSENFPDLPGWLQDLKKST